MVFITHGTELHPIVIDQRSGAYIPIKAGVGLGDSVIHSMPHAPLENSGVVDNVTLWVGCIEELAP
jgi:hypothetical protein